MYEALQLCVLYITLVFIGVGFVGFYTWYISLDHLLGYMLIDAGFVD